MSAAAKKGSSLSGILMASALPLSGIIIAVLSGRRAWLATVQHLPAGQLRTEP